MSDVLRRLGLCPSGGNYRMISSRIRLAGISTEHFLGRGWSKGKTATSDRRIRRTRYPDNEVFVENSPLLSGSKVAMRLLERGWQYKCRLCGLSEWRNKPITLHLDHINGIRNDNRFSNLRFLCPNCHQQTSTWGNKRR
jgi:5-methylcytosine-specific restriction endonuclease McrA